AAHALSEQRAFREPIPWRELWTRFAVLGATPGLNNPPPPVREVRVFGGTSSEDVFVAELAKGSVGAIGKALESFVLADFNPAELGAWNRGPALSRRSSRRSRRPDGDIGRTADTKAERETNGLLGEAFVYEQFRHVLPEFDEFNWRSENRG